MQSRNKYRFCCFDNKQLTLWAFNSGWSQTLVKPNARNDVTVQGADHWWRKINFWVRNMRRLQIHRIEPCLERENVPGNIQKNALARGRMWGANWNADRKQVARPICAVRNLFFPFLACTLQTPGALYRFVSIRRSRAVFSRLKKMYAEDQWCCSSTAPGRLSDRYSQIPLFCTTTLKPHGSARRTWHFSNLSGAPNCFSHVLFISRTSIVSPCDVRGN